VESQSPQAEKGKGAKGKKGTLGAGDDASLTLHDRMSAATGDRLIRQHLCSKYREKIAEDIKLKKCYLRFGNFDAGTGDSGSANSSGGSAGGGDPGSSLSEAQQRRRRAFVIKEPVCYDEIANEGVVRSRK
jgi:hypothetical protein